VPEHADVAIIGGGPVGSALALALRDTGTAVVLLESRAAGAASHDERPLALAHGSRLILERLGVWDSLPPASPIHRIHISQRGGFGRTTLDAAQSKVPALGYVLHYGALAQALEQCALPAAIHDVRLSAITTALGVPTIDYNVDGRPRTLTASLVVIADGGGLPESTRVRTVDYGQCAVTARVHTSLPHAGTAYERFTPEGPLALLPDGAGMALIWTTPTARALPLCEATERAFLAGLQEQFGGRLGRFTAAGARHAYPLVLKFVSSVSAPRTAVVGNAAQTLHPVAGQGFNVGLRDAWELAEQIRRVPRATIGDEAMLAPYRARRRLDRGGGIFFTDALVRLFSNDYAPLRIARGIGLAAFDSLPPVKDFVVRRMLFGARG
jgi:2-octaprenyl-6-methoxyphenol hydroxylase